MEARVRLPPSSREPTQRQTLASPSRTGSLQLPPADAMWLWADPGWDGTGDMSATRGTLVLDGSQDLDQEQQVTNPTQDRPSTLDGDEPMPCRARGL